MSKYAVFLRGINVGAHHKVAMKELSIVFETLGFSKIKTLLNSGNIVFQSELNSPTKIETFLEIHLAEKFGFSIPVIVRTAEEINAIYNLNPFKNIEVDSNTRLYISLLKSEIKSSLSTPWQSNDMSFAVIQEYKNNVFSVLDFSKNKTPKAMELLEKQYSKNITTRNWNTIEKIVNML
jgi:uncharacterized protein (DUF1697 family)